MADIIESTERATWDQHVQNKLNPHNVTAGSFTLGTNKIYLVYE